MTKQNAEIEGHGTSCPYCGKCHTEPCHREQRARYWWASRIALLMLTDTELKHCRTIDAARVDGTSEEL